MSTPVGSPNQPSAADLLLPVVSDQPTELRVNQTDEGFTLIPGTITGSTDNGIRIPVTAYFQEGTGEFVLLTEAGGALELGNDGNVAALEDLYAQGTIRFYPGSGGPGAEGLMGEPLEGHDAVGLNDENQWHIDLSTRWDSEADENAGVIRTEGTNTFESFTAYNSNNEVIATSPEELIDNIETSQFEEGDVHWRTQISAHYDHANSRGVDYGVGYTFATNNMSQDTLWGYAQHSPADNLNLEHFVLMDGSGVRLENKASWVANEQLEFRAQVNADSHDQTIGTNGGEGVLEGAVEAEYQFSDNFRAVGGLGATTASDESTFGAFGGVEYDISDDFRINGGVRTPNAPGVLVGDGVNAPFYAGFEWDAF